MNGFQLYMKHMGMHLRSAMQYKSSFWMQSGGQFLMALAMMLGVWYAMARFRLVDGFTAEQVLLCAGLNLTAFTVSEVFVRGFDLFPGMIRQGSFDQVLLKPRSPMLLVLCHDAAYHRLARVVQSVLMLVLVIPGAGICWDWTRVLTVLLMLLGAAAMYSALFLIRGTVAFFAIDSIEFMNIFIDGSREFGGYPVGIYGKVMLNLLTFVLPLACVQYYPLLYLLGRGEWWYMALPLAGAMVWIPAVLFWRFGVRKYRSTGS